MLTLLVALRLVQASLNADRNTNLPIRDALALDPHQSPLLQAPLGGAQVQPSPDDDP